MNYQGTQMDLLSEEKSPTETLNYALARERGQASQKKMNNSHAPIGRDILSFTKITSRDKTSFQSYQRPKQHKSRTAENAENAKICPAKIDVCRICKKVDHFAKLCKPEMPSRLPYNMQQTEQMNYTGTQQQQRYYCLAKKHAQQKIRKINEEETNNNQEEA